MTTPTAQSGPSAENASWNDAYERARKIIHDHCPNGHWITGWNTLAMALASEFETPPAGARDAITDQFVAECGEEYFCVKRMSWDQKSMRAAIEYALTGKADARDDIHTCNYYCTRPACIRAQRDELVAAMEATQPAATGAGEDRVSLTHDELQAIKDAAYRDGYERRHLEVLVALA